MVHWFLVNPGKVGENGMQENSLSRFHCKTLAVKYPGYCYVQVSALIKTRGFWVQLESMPH